MRNDGLNGCAALIFVCLFVPIIGTLFAIPEIAIFNAMCGAGIPYFGQAHIIAGTLSGLIGLCASNLTKD